MSCFCLLVWLVVVFVCLFVYLFCLFCLFVCLFDCLFGCFALLCFALLWGRGRERRGKRASHLGESRFFARRRGENVENRNYRLPIAEKSKNENFGTQKHEICTAPRRDAQIRNSIGNFQSEMRPEARKSKGGIARASLEHRSSNHLGAVGPDHFGAPQ